MPGWFEEEPPMLPGDEFYMTAWSHLDTCRSSGFDIGPIPWRDIVHYAKVYGLDSDLIPGFVQIIRAMDAEYLKWVKKQSKNK